MSSIKFLMDFAKQGDLKATLTDLKAINSELQKNKGLQKDFGDSFTTATKSVSTNLDEIAAKTKKAHDALKVTGDAKEIAKLTKEISLLRIEYDNLSKSTNDMLLKNQKLAKATAQTDREQIKNATELIKQKQLKNKVEQAEQKQAQKTATEHAKLNSIYAQESARLNDLRKKYKDMALSEGTASKEARILLREITALDGKLKKVDASVGQFQRNVGNYASGLKKFGGNLTTLLGIGSGVMLVRDAFESFGEFQQGLADLSALTGLDAAGQDMQFLKESSLDLAKTSTASASEILEAYKLIGSAQPALLKNVKALDKMTKSILVLAEASGLELPEAATAATNIMNQLGYSVDQADRVINTLAAGAKEGAAEIPDLSAAMLEAGVSMKAANIEIEEGTALIETLAERGIKGSEAGTKLRNVLTKLNAVKGLPREALAQLNSAGVDMELLGDKTQPVLARLTELNKIAGNSTAIMKVFGLENQDAASILIDGTKTIDRLTKAVTGTNEAYEQAEKRTGTVGQEFTKLKNTFEALVIEFIDGGGDFASTLKFIRENLETIITVVAKVVKGYLVFKGVQLALNASMKVTAISQYLGGLLKLSAASKVQTVMTLEAKAAQDALNLSMRNNVIGLIIVAVYELADALDLFQSRADAIAQKIAFTNALLSKANELRDAEFDKEIAGIKEANQIRLDLANESEKELIEAQNRGELRKAYIDQREQIDKELTQLDKDQRKTKENLAKEQLAFNLRQNAADNAVILDASKSNAQIEAEIVIEENQKQIDELLKKKETYNAELETLNHEQAVDNKATTDEIGAQERKANEKAKQDRDKRLEEERKFLEDRLKNNKEYQRKLAELEAGNIKDEGIREIQQERLRNKFAQQDIEERFRLENETIMKMTSISEADKLILISENKAIETQLILETEEATQNKITDLRAQQAKERTDKEKEALEKELQDKEDYLNSELKLLDDELKQEEINLLNSSATKEEIEMELLLKKAEILEKEIELRKDAGKETLDAELELAKLRQQIEDDGLEKAKQKREEQLEEIKDFTEKAAEISFESAEKKVESNIEGIEKEIDLQEENVERQRELAEQGLANTLAFEKQVQAENEARLIEEQKRLEKIKKTETFFNLMSEYAKEDPDSAAAKALIQIGIADAIAARFGDGGIVADEIAKQNGGILKGASHKQGGILIEAEGDEGLFSKNEMKNLGKDNFYTLKNALKQPIDGQLMKNQNETMMAVLPQQRMIIDFTSIKNELREVKNAIENKPVPSFTMDRDGNIITKSEAKLMIKHTVQKRKRV